MNVAELNRAICLRARWSITGVHASFVQEQLENFRADVLAAALKEVEAETETIRKGIAEIPGSHSRREELEMRGRRALAACERIAARLEGLK
jgi:hypothetical protein